MLSPWYFIPGPTITLFKYCLYSFTFVFLGGDGKFKIKTLLRPGDTFTADKTIDFNNDRTLLLLA